MIDDTRAGWGDNVPAPGEFCCSPAGRERGGTVLGNITVSIFIWCERELNYWAHPTETGLL